MKTRVGVNWGRVLREHRLQGTDLFGNTVNAAARLMRRAAAGEVLAAASVLQDPVAERALAGATQETLMLKGFLDGVSVLRRRP